jgi:membrane associated rhomboid family serine protease
LPLGGLPSFRNAGAALAVVTLIFSLLAEIFSSTLGPLLLMMPELVTGRFYVWQLLTYAFVETSAFGLLFGCVMLWLLGANLEAIWGRKKSLAMLLGVPLVAGLLTCFASLAIAPLRLSVFAAGNVLVSVMTLGLGLRLGPRPVNLWGFTITGNILAIFVAVNAAIGAVYAGWAILPTAIALLLTYLESRFQLPKVKRKSHLQALDGGNVLRGSDKYKH